MWSAARNSNAPMQRRILRYVESRLRELSCLVVSDYAKGVVSATLMAELTRLAAIRRIPVVVDPKVEHFSYYKGVTVITPNHLGGDASRRRAWRRRSGDQEAGAIIRQRLGCQSVLITRGEKGMSLYEADGVVLAHSHEARQVYDVTGAGDTVVGTLALALSTGASIKRCRSAGQPRCWYRRRHGRHGDLSAPAALGGLRP